jgi:hypothetical protein
MMHSSLVDQTDMGGGIFVAWEPVSEHLPNWRYTTQHTGQWRQQSRLMKALELDRVKR